jgi:monofunctional biosynthetic peptidoglycan transglycosylase
VSKGAKSGPARPLWKRIARVAVIVALVPVVLVPIYRIVRPVSLLMIAEFVTGTRVERTWAPLDAIAPALVASVVMSEDGKFCAHHGVDWEELNKVITDEDGPSRGASTVAMQTVKNLFLWPSYLTYVRKAIEIPLALWGDLVWGKRRTMELYLNVAEFGPGIFGAEAAARHYFRRPAKELTAGQAALLTAALPNPRARDAARPSAAMRNRAASIASQAAVAGAYIDCLN